MIARLQERLGQEYVDEKLRDLVSGQASAMLGFLAGALTRIVGGGFALFNVLSLLVVTPVVAFYLLRDWPRVVARLDGWLPRRYAGVLRAQAREVDRILSAWLRGQALCCMLLALFYATALSMVGLDLGLIVGLSAGLLSFIPYVGSIAGGVTSIGLAFAQFPTWTGVADGRGRVRDGAAAGRLRDLSPLPGRPGGAARGVGDLRAVRRRRGVRLPGRAAGGAGGGDHRRAGAVLAAALPGQPALPRPAARSSTAAHDAASLPLPFAHGPLRRGGLPARRRPTRTRWPGWTRRWPQGRLALWGEQGRGKTHLLHVWAARSGATLRAGAGAGAAAGAAAAGRWRSTTRDAAAERPLLHLLNAAAEAGLPVLLAARDAPARWPTRLPDLASRLRASRPVELAEPGDAMLRACSPACSPSARWRCRSRCRTGCCSACPATRPPCARRGAAGRAALAAGRRVTPAIAADALAIAAADVH